ncbi:MAG: PEP-CTERM sorting domain-containing protein [Planctomycetaceae bacterium]|nr:PEP-CTERM sorting domain-containing protein [Planctomycetaceae bacterium]
MKKILALALTLVVAASTANAAPIWSVKPVGQAPNDVYSIYIDGDNLNGTFDTIFFQAKATTGTFINTNSGAAAGVPRPAGEAFTYPNRMITADPLDFPGGLALTQVGLVNTAQELSYTAGKLGGTVSTGAEVNGDLFLGNVNTSAGGGGTFQIQLITGGNVVYDTGVLAFPVPEPATFALAGLGLVGLVAASRRKA